MQLCSAHMLPHFPVTENDFPVSSFELQLYDVFEAWQVMLQTVKSLINAVLVVQTSSWSMCLRQDIDAMQGSTLHNISFISITFIE